MPSRTPPRFRRRTPQRRPYGRSRSRSRDRGRYRSRSRSRSRSHGRSRGRSRSRDRTRRQRRRTSSAGSCDGWGRLAPLELVDRIEDMWTRYPMFQTDWRNLIRRRGTTSSLDPKCHPPSFLASALRELLGPYTPPPPRPPPGPPPPPLSCGVRVPRATPAVKPPTPPRRDRGRGPSPSLSSSSEKPAKPQSVPPAPPQRGSRKKKGQGQGSSQEPKESKPKHKGKPKGASPEAAAAAPAGRKRARAGAAGDTDTTPDAPDPKRRSRPAADGKAAGAGAEAPRKKVKPKRRSDGSVVITVRVPQGKKIGLRFEKHAPGGGLVVEAVDTPSPAARAGAALALGMRLVEAAGQPCAKPSELKQLLRTHPTAQLVFAPPQPAARPVRSVPAEVRRRRRQARSARLATEAEEAAMESEGRRMDLDDEDFADDAPSLTDGEGGVTGGDSDDAEDEDDVSAEEDEEPAGDVFQSASGGGGRSVKMPPSPKASDSGRNEFSEKLLQLAAQLRSGAPLPQPPPRPQNTQPAPILLKLLAQAVGGGVQPQPQPGVNQAAALLQLASSGGLPLITQAIAAAAAATSAAPAPLPRAAGGPASTTQRSVLPPGGGAARDAASIRLTGLLPGASVPQLSAACFAALQAAGHYTQTDANPITGGQVSGDGSVVLRLNTAADCQNALSLGTLDFGGRALKIEPLTVSAETPVRGEKKQKNANAGEYVPEAIGDRG
eukprot:TRINITY_DN6458_c0_g3_i1.p1 TRINITY_DN6458_c0_g3~~TRINITY_DN6458_c0_g3_i1.p1  ORF type:complete len:720 (+),score=172.99 TRINITY_DN6458_c0_g3_i1:82-2241(+)